MQSKEKPDTKQQNNVKQSRVMPIPMVITLIIAIATGSWALSGEIHNYRLLNIVLDLERNYVADAELSVKVDYVREVQVEVTTKLTAILIDISELSKDVRTLISNQ